MRRREGGLGGGGEGAVHTTFFARQTLLRSCVRSIACEERRLVLPCVYSHAKQELSGPRSGLRCSVLCHSRDVWI